MLLWFLLDLMSLKANIRGRWGASLGAKVAGTAKPRINGRGDCYAIFLPLVLQFKRNRFFKRPIGTGGVSNVKACRAVCYGWFYGPHRGKLQWLLRNFISHKIYQWFIIYWVIWSSAPCVTLKWRRRSLLLRGVLYYHFNHILNP